ncbi:hypothetical protein PAE9249_02154 [Paenibacillus sp. CECT 9249]|nr:hypothetical protein PAE9249_02154 [Paenibacillus sp. CECT 9249]
MNNERHRLYPKTVSFFVLKKKFKTDNYFYNKILFQIVLTK